ncbi:unnamed protein product [Blepharisma stoltei]|uniref:Uncharacterized protein n=1 Tax=Blepharisma stoltei TaxID=1481888 RepID=A0AAU9K799_9CILI|nr:unnamed protein product [Blepharisma stoltei]
MSTGGFALHGYNEGSLLQRMLLLKASDSFGDCLSHASSLSNDQIVIADYGSSEGFNSMIFLSRVLSKFRETSPQSILVVHNDLPDNNWVKTFKTLLEFEESYIKVPNVYFSAIGRSFYDQVLPNNSVHLGFSSAALHWLSRPLCAPDHVIPSASKDPEFKAIVAEVAHNDLVTLLRQRHKELVNSGRLIIQILDDTLPTVMSSVIFNSTTEIMCAKGFISEEEKRSITVPTYGRSDEEIQRALAEVSSLYRVISLGKVGGEQFLHEDLPPEVLPKVLDGFKRLSLSSLKGILQKVVKKSEEERNQIYEHYIREVTDFIETNQNWNWSQYHSIVLEKISP